MGMFDYVRCDAPLPDGKPTPRDFFQTKDFGLPQMDIYTITAEGRLIEHVTRSEEVPKEERPYWGKPEWFNDDGTESFFAFLGCIRKVPVEDRDMNYHGYLNFYGGDRDEWREFNAKFTDGQLVEIVQVPDTPA